MHEHNMYFQNDIGVVYTLFTDDTTNSPYDICDITESSIKLSSHEDIYTYTLHKHIEDTSPPNKLSEKKFVLIEPSEESFNVIKNYLLRINDILTGLTQNVYVVEEEDFLNDLRRTKFIYDKIYDNIYDLFDQYKPLDEKDADKVNNLLNEGFGTPGWVKDKYLNRR